MQDTDPRALKSVRSVLTAVLSVGSVSCKTRPRCLRGPDKAATGPAPLQKAPETTAGGLLIVAFTAPAQSLRGLNGSAPRPG